MRLSGSARDRRRWGRSVASIRTYKTRAGVKRWEVRWRDGASSDRSKAFGREGDAKR